MPLESHLQRSKLRLAFEVYAPRASKALRAWLVDEIASLDNRSGQQVTITSGNGQYVAFNNSADGLRAASDLSAFWSEMIDLYDLSKAALIVSGVTTPTEAQVVAEMMARLRPVRSFTADFSGIHHDHEEVFS